MESLKKYQINPAELPQKMKEMTPGRKSSKYRNSIASFSSSNILAALPLLGVSHSQTKIMDQVINQQNLNPYQNNERREEMRHGFATSHTIIMTLHRSDIDKSRGRIPLELDSIKNSLEAKELLILKSFPIFKQTDEAILDRFIDHSERVAPSKGTLLMKERCPNKWIYILIKGKVNLFAKRKFGQICQMQPGELIGILEASILEYSLYNVEVISTDSIVYRCDYVV